MVAVTATRHKVSQPCAALLVVIDAARAAPVDSPAAFAANFCLISSTLTFLVYFTSSNFDFGLKFSCSASSSCSVRLMLHGLLGATSSSATFAIGAQLLGAKVGALHAVKAIDRIDHRCLREGTHQLLERGIAQAQYGIQYGFVVLVAVL